MHKSEVVRNRRKEEWYERVQRRALRSVDFSHHAMKEKLCRALDAKLEEETHSRLLDELTAHYPICSIQTGKVGFQNYVMQHWSIS